jgi:uncharacterized protein
MNRKPRIVHSSAGRLRVHLPDPGGRFAERLRQIPGVRSAEASELTGNILILFDPRQTEEKTLLSELDSGSAETIHCLPNRVTAVKDRTSLVRKKIVELRSSAEGDQQGVYLTGPKASLYQVFGWTSVGLSVVGAVTPGIPTAPFVVLASYFFIRSSPKAHDWLMRSRWFGPFLRDWEEGRGVRRSVKVAAVGLMAAGAVFTWLAGLPPVVLATIWSLEAIGLVIVLRLPVVEDATPAPTE